MELHYQIEHFKFSGSYEVQSAPARRSYRVTTTAERHVEIDYFADALIGSAGFSKMIDEKTLPGSTVVSTSCPEVLERLEEIL